MSEATLRKYVREGLHARGVLNTHHEDILNTGIPDLSYSGFRAHGWIELKWLEEWPKRETTAVRIDHYTKEQKHFLLTRGRVGGRCWLLLRVGKEHLLYDHERAQTVGTLTRGEMLATACLHNNKGRIDFEQLVRVLTK